MGALTKTGPVLQTKSFPSEGVFKIDIDLSFDDIYITTKDTSEIKVTYYTGKTKDLNAPRWTHLQLRITRRQRYLRTIHR